MKIEIEKAENGYITDLPFPYNMRIHNSLRDAMQSICEDMLLHFEGKSRNFKGDKYGKIILEIVVKADSPT